MGIYSIPNHFIATTESHCLYLPTPLLHGTVVLFLFEKARQVFHTASMQVFQAVSVA